MRRGFETGDLVLLLSGGVSWQEFAGTVRTLGERVPRTDLVVAGAPPEASWYFDPPLEVDDRENDVLWEVGWGEPRLLLIAPGEPVEGLMTREPETA